MKINIRVRELNYGDLAVLAMPVLHRAASRRTGAAAMMLEAWTQLPDHMIRSISETIPEETKREILVESAAESRGRLTEYVNALLAKHRMGITVSEIILNRQLEITAKVKEIDYPCLVEKYLPEVREKLLELGGMVKLLHPVIRKASAQELCSLLDRFCSSQKEFLLPSLINQNQKVLISRMETLAQNQGIRLKIESVSVTGRI